MKFIETVRASVYSPEFYQLLRNVPFKSSLRYFVKLTLALSFIATLFFSALLLPPLIETLKKENIERLISYFPFDLEITFRDGTAYSNSNEPRYIDGTEEFRAALGESAKNHIAVIDTETPVSLEAFERYRALIWIARDSIVSKNNGRTTIQSLTRFPNVTINQDRLRAYAERAENYFPLVPFLLPIFVYVGITIASLAYLLYLFLLAFIIMLIGKVRHVPLTYKMAYHVGLHAITLPLLIKLFFEIVPVFPRSVPLLFSAILCLAVFFNLKKGSAAASSPPQEISAAL